MAKKTKVDASTAAYKMALAKLVERHRGLKLALIADVIGMAAATEPYAEEISIMAEADVTEELTKQ